MMSSLVPAIAAACKNDVLSLSSLPDKELLRADARGSSSLHWASGTGSLDAVKYLIVHRRLDPNLYEGSVEAPASGLKKKKTSGITGRTPLHFACRNGHLAVVAFLLGLPAVSWDRRASGGVSPFQLAVWQNHFEVAKLLVLGLNGKKNENGVDPAQLNDFACGAQHWIGLAPRARADDGAAIGPGGSGAGGNGTGLIPLASWLGNECGLDFLKKQKQGHTALHKAAWGGHLSLVQWICGTGAAIRLSLASSLSSSSSPPVEGNCPLGGDSESIVLDDQRDAAGNYAADIAEMGGHAEMALWLRLHRSPARANACAVLGLSLGVAFGEGQREKGESKEAAAAQREALVRAAYLKQCRATHPDHKLRDATNKKRKGSANACNSGDGIRSNTDGDGGGSGSTACSGSAVAAGVGDGESLSSGQVDDFAVINRAYRILADDAEALRHAQRNENHSLPLLLEMMAVGAGGVAKGVEVVSRDDTGSSTGDAEDSRGESIHGGWHTAGLNPLSIFKAKLVAAVLEHDKGKEVADDSGGGGGGGGREGLPLAMLPKKFKQVWGEDLPRTAEDFGLLLPPSAFPENDAVDRRRGCASAEETVGTGVAVQGVPTPSDRATAAASEILTRGAAAPQKGHFHPPAKKLGLMPFLQKYCADVVRVSRVRSVIKDSPKVVGVVEGVVSEKRGGCEGGAKKELSTGPALGQQPKQNRSEVRVWLRDNVHHQAQPYI